MTLSQLQMCFLHQITSKTEVNCHPDLLIADGTKKFQLPIFLRFNCVQSEAKAEKLFANMMDVMIYLPFRKTE